ncbi:MAG: FAD-dependent oxidoreductase [Myxococcota bacterium]
MTGNGNDKGLSRRGFLQNTALAGAAAGVASLTLTHMTACDDEPVDASKVKWDERFEVVVVGAGGAGLTAAVAAKEAGVGSVVVLEKAAVVGGSTSLSGGVVQAAGTSFQIAGGTLGDTPTKHAQYWMQAGEGISDQALVELLANKAPGAIDWMVAHGLTYVSVYGVDPIPTVDPALMVPRIHVPSGGGPNPAPGTGAVHVAALSDAATAAGVTVRTEVDVKALVVDKDEGVVGVKVLVGAATKYIRARRAVVLASGGFDRNKEMARHFSPQQLWELETGVCYCAPNNLGDGIRYGMAIGADLAALGGTIGVPAVTMGCVPFVAGSPAVPGIWVNKYGMRFVNEQAHYAYKMRAVFAQEGHVAWAIFDESVKALGGTVLGGLWGAWSADLSEEIASGKVKTGASLKELAARIGVNEDQLGATVAQWNDAMADPPTDPVFGRTIALSSLVTAPYYATQVTSVNLGSCGGLRIDTSARVIDTLGQPIPRLYAAGMVAGGFIGPYYPGSGTAVMSTIVFGRIAGEAAAERSWPDRAAAPRVERPRRPPPPARGDRARRGVGRGDAACQRTRFTWTRGRALSGVPSHSRRPVAHAERSRGE